MAEKALTDEKPEVRSSAAAALGAMHSKASIAKLREAADDQDPSVWRQLLGADQYGPSPALFP